MSLKLAAFRSDLFYTGEALLPPFGFQALLCVLDLGGLPAAGYRPNPCNPEAADARSVV